MALLFVDSFDHYTVPAEKWTGSSSFVDWTMGTAANGRNGTRCLQGKGYNAQNSITKTIPGGSKSTIIAGFALSRAAVLSWGLKICSFSEGTSAPPTLFEQVRLELNTALGLLRVMRGATVLAQGTTVLTARLFVYIEMKVTVHPTAGAVTVRLNGANEIVLTNVNTQGSTNNIIDSFSLFNEGVADFSDTHTFYDDLYICDSLGAQNNTFLGDIRVEFIKPTGAGALAGWTPNPAGANYTKVNEVPPNDADTTYVSTLTPGTRDTYAHGALSPAAALIKGVQPIVVARKDDAGSRVVSAVYRQGGVNYDVGANLNLAVGYTTFASIQELNPATGVAFTLAEINANEIGLDLIS